MQNYLGDIIMQNRQKRTALKQTVVTSLNDEQNVSSLGEIGKENRSRLDSS